MHYDNEREAWEAKMYPGKPVTPQTLSQATKIQQNQIMESNAQRVQSEPCPSKKGAKSATVVDTPPVKEYLDVDIRISVSREQLIEEVADLRDAICNFDYKIIRID